MLPPPEIRLGIQRAVRESISVDVEECARHLAHQFGISRVTVKLQKVVRSEAKILVDAGELCKVNGELRRT